MSYVWISPSGAPEAHALVGASHTASSLTTGHFLKATGAAAFAFGTHGLSASDVGAAASAAGVTNGDAHDHSGGDGAQIDHTTLSNIGTNTHAEVDTHLAASAEHITANQKIATINFCIGGGEAVVATGVHGALHVGFACTITRASIAAPKDASSSAVVDIWKDTTANFPPTIADTITASAKPTLSSAQVATDATLTGWTTAITALDWLVFNVDSCSTATMLTISLVVTKP